MRNERSRRRRFGRPEVHQDTMVPAVPLSLIYMGVQNALHVELGEPRTLSSPRTVIANNPFLEQNPMSISVSSARVGASSHLHKSHQSYR